MHADDTDYYMQFVEALDNGPFEVSNWEADFLSSLLERRPKTITEKQLDIIKRMSTKYLGENI